MDLNCNNYSLCRKKVDVRITLSKGVLISTFKVLCGRASTTLDLASESAPC